MFPNIPMRILFILFGLFEALVAYLYFTASPETIMETHTGMVMSDSALRIVRGFACALSAIAVTAFLGAFYVKDTRGIAALSAACFTYNATVFYYCLHPGFETDFYEKSVFIHGGFALLFAACVVYCVSRDLQQKEG